MSCSDGKMTKKRIITLLVIGIGIIGIIYAVSRATNNFAILTLSPLVLAFAACPIMCGVMGVGMWLMGRHSRNKERNLVKNIAKYLKFDVVNEPGSHDHENNGIVGFGKESRAKLGAEAKINDVDSHNLDLPGSRSKGNPKSDD